MPDVMLLEWQLVQMYSLINKIFPIFPKSALDQLAFLSMGLSHEGA